MAAALPGSLPTPQAIKEPRESSAKTSLAVGETDPAADRQQGWGSSAHTAEQTELYTSRSWLTAWSTQVFVGALKLLSPINRIQF